MVSSCASGRVGGNAYRTSYIFYLFLCFGAWFDPGSSLASWLRAGFWYESFLFFFSRCLLAQARSEPFGYFVCSFWSGVLHSLRSSVPVSGVTRSCEHRRCFLPPPFFRQCLCAQVVEGNARVANLLDFLFVHLGVGFFARFALAPCQFRV
ncbi:hypothetical protein B0H11DRAFT_1006481 [Mycena galericulata]|nr:hypothetical protein B0H11DRAFT_1006481 [Mycena galericulata]